MLREYIYLTDDELQLVPICDDCGPNAVPIMRREEIVRCKDCIHRPYYDDYGIVHRPLKDNTCFAFSEDPDYRFVPKDNFFCGDGERREE